MDLINIAEFLLPGMTKLIQTIKNIFYSNTTRQYAAILIALGMLAFFTAASAPITLADESNVSGNAFLTVQNLATDANDSNDLFLQNNIFIAVNSCITRIDVSFPVPKTQGRVVVVTAYSSTPDQTDGSPFITANGTYVRDGIIAANFLPFGAKVRFPEMYGDKIFIVADRMAKKNSHKIDIWMPSRDIALQFGVKRLVVEIISGA